MTTRTVEPPDGWILADKELLEAWVRDDLAAAQSDWDEARWYPMSHDNTPDPREWLDVPEDVRNGVRLVVADAAEEVRTGG